MYYTICPYCKCNLDPGERCDCESVAEKKQNEIKKLIEINTVTKQYELNLEEVS